MIRLNPTPPKVTRTNSLTRLFPGAFHDVTSTVVTQFITDQNQAKENIQSSVKKINPKFYKEQMTEILRTIANLEQHYKKVRSKAAQLPDKTRILILDFSQSPYAPSSHHDPVLLNLIRQHQLDGDISSASIFRNLLGFDRNDPRVTIWDVVNDPNGENTPNLHDLKSYHYFITTGSPAMVNQANEKKWIQKGSEVLKQLVQAGVPGLATCFGFQLLSHTFGSSVGPRPHNPGEEFGMATLHSSTLVNQIPLFHSVFDSPTTSPLQKSSEVFISTIHYEVVQNMPQFEGATILFGNDFWHNKGMIFPLNGLSLTDAISQDRYVIGLQDHIERTPLGQLLSLSSHNEIMKKEGCPLYKQLLRDTPEVRKIFINILDMLLRTVRS